LTLGIMKNDRPIVIKKIKKGGHGGHHGGAWKVAYADFVTAMMAFFLLMWLINTTTPEQKRGIADYFAPESVSRSESGTGASWAGRRPRTTRPAKDRLPSRRDGAATEEQSEINSKGQDNADGSASSGRSNAQNAALEQAAARLRQAMQDKPDLAELSKHVLIDDTPEGVRIQLVDQDGRSMFEAGKADPKPYAQRLLQEVAKTVSGLPNRVSIVGHTDGGSFQGPGGYSNWDLSAARANASLKVLLDSGMGQDHVAEVGGRAGSDPLYPITLRLRQSAHQHRAAARGAGSATRRLTALATRITPLCAIGLCRARVSV
jgi:chemotaxis protein MotB